ncbi:unnamed protein product [Mytilus edulis]|uniref:Ig-like domain-containing protein n=1 Tax=Mytilus edulis TaxID=6550 RepID=A0A8S3TSD8_MYTED|nr:unnamed protein product [Mytilus edulis]
MTNKILMLFYGSEEHGHSLFETRGEYDHGTFKCVIRNAAGTVESEPVLLYGKFCDVQPTILEQKTIPSDSAKLNIGLECSVMSYLPLKSVKWYRQVEERLQVERIIDVDLIGEGPWTFTFETPKKHDHGTFKCVASNEVGTVESEPVLLFCKLNDVPPKILEQKAILSDSAKLNIGLECSVMSYLPLKSVKWCRQVEEQLQSSSETSSCSSIIDEDETSSQISSDECSTEYENDAKTDSSNDSFESHDSFATDSKRENINTTTYATPGQR